MELEWSKVSLSEADGSDVFLAQFGPCVLEIHEKNGTWTSAVSWGERVVDTTGRFTSELAKQRAVSMAFLTCPVIPRHTLWDDDSYESSIGVKNMSDRTIKVRYADVHEGVIWRWVVYRSDLAIEEFDNFMDAIAYAESVVLDTTRIAEIGTVRVRTESEVAESVMKKYIQRIETERDEAVRKYDALRLRVINAPRSTAVGPISSSVDTLTVIGTVRAPGTYGIVLLERDETLGEGADEDNR